MTTTGRITIKHGVLGLTVLALVLVVALIIRLRQDAQRVHPQTLLPGHFSCASALAFTPNGQRLFTSDWDGTVRVWQMPQGRLLDRFTLTESAINTLAVSPNGAQLAMGNDSGVVERREIGSGRSLPALVVGLPVRYLAFSPDSQEIAVVAHNARAVYRFDTQTGDARPPLPCPHNVATIAYAPDGKTLAVADTHSISLWDCTTGQSRLTLPQTDIAHLAFSPDSTVLVSSGVYRNVSLYHTADGRLIRRLNLDQPGNATFLPGSHWFLVGQGADISRYDARTGKAAPSLLPATLLASMPHFLMRVFPSLRDYQRLPIGTITTSPDGKYVAYGCGEIVTLIPLSP